MSKSEYLERLKKGLRGLSQNEIDDCMEYYEEYFYDVGEENVESVIKELGSPEDVAKKVSAEACIERIDNGSEKDKKSFGSIFILIAAICSAPFWGPIGIAIIAVIFALMIAAFAVIFAVGISGVAMVVAGIIVFGLGFVVLTTSLADGLVAIGGGLIITSIGLLMTMIILALVRLVIMFFVWILKGIFKKKGGKQ